MLNRQRLIKEDGKVRGLYRYKRENSYDFRAIVTDSTTGVQVLNKQFSTRMYGYKVAHRYAVNALTEFLGISRRTDLYKEILRNINRYD